MNKFKIGDKVIKVRGKQAFEDIEILDTGTVVGEWNGIGYRIFITKGKYKGESSVTETENLELESVYNSPLYQALL